MRYLSEIFWGHFWDVCSLVSNNAKFLVCLSVCQLAYFPTEIRCIQGYLQCWMRYLSEICWRLSWDICILDPNISDFLVCLSAWQLAYFLTEQMLIQGYLHFWMRYLSEICWKHSWNVCKLVLNASHFLVFQSVCYLTHFLSEIM